MSTVETMTIGNVIVRFCYESGRLAGVERHCTSWSTAQSVKEAMHEIEQRIDPEAEIVDGGLSVSGKIMIERWKVQYGTETE